MNVKSLALIGLVPSTCSLLSKPVDAQDDFRRAAFQAVRWIPEVKIDGQWYQLRSIDDVPVQEIIEFIVQQEDEEWARRFAEDLVEMLTKMGKPPGETIEVVVRDPETGKEKTLEKVPLTRANRDAILKLRKEFRSRPLVLKPEALHGALEAFQTALNERWSYRHANDADFDAAIRSLRQKIDAGLSADQFGIELQRIVDLGIDGHAAVSGYRLPPGGYLPFLIEPHEDRFVAFLPDRTSFLADDFPYLTKIDGKDIQVWCDAASALVAKGSSQYVRRHCLSELRHVDYHREALKLPQTDTLKVELSAKDGQTHKMIALPVAKSRPVYGVWPSGGSRLLEGNVGYLRLADMEKAISVPEIKKWMPKFRDTAGLVIDVRDNGGGDRDALLLLYAYLAASNDPPRVFTAAAYRLHKQHREDHLAQRFMYRVDAKEWTPDERRAVAAFTKNFKPEWELPEGQFSDWHYLALRRLNEPDIYHYDKSVVVLMNSKCFSATDIFLAGLKGIGKVTLLGTASGGGSALVQEVGLGATPFRLRIGSMASFQTNGKLFDGNGVEPDVTVESIPEYHIGKGDNVLEEAVRRVKRR